MRNLSILFLLLLPGPSAFTQDYIFRVMANKGSNMAKTSTDDTWKPIKFGDALHAGYWVKVVDKAYLGLVHNSGKTAALEDPGEFKIESIETSIKNKKKGLGAKYTDFVFEAIGNEDLFGEDKVVTRGISDQVFVELPPDAEVVHSKVHLRWKSINEYNEYVVTVKGIFDDVLARIDVKGVYTILDLNDEALSNEQTFVIVVSVKGDESIRSGDHIINRLNDEDLQQMIPTPEENNVITSMDLIVLASYYEINNLLIDASNFYSEAMLKSPDVEDFKKFYDSFISRHGLK